MAVFPNDSGYGDYSSDGTSKFIPEIWSGKLQVKFYKSTVLSAITNNDWEGEIKGAGDKVKIRTTPTVTIRDYKRGLTLTTEVPESANIELQIDKGKYFAVVVDDVNQTQADVKLMDMFTSDAAEQMKIAIDTDVLANVGASVSADNKGDTAGVLSNDIDLGKTGEAIKLLPGSTSTANECNVLDFILKMGLVLDEQNVPESGRFLVVPPWMAMMLKQSDLKAAYLTGDPTSPLRNGKVGQVDRFTLYTSQLLPTAADTGTKYYVLGGTTHGITFASQIAKVETLRSTSTFGHIVRGLNVYGYDVVKPEALVLGYVYK